LFLFIRLVRTNIISINKQQTQKSVFTQDSAFLARLASLFSTVFEMIQQHTFHRRHEVIKTRSFLSDHQEEFSPETRCTEFTLNSKENVENPKPIVRLALFDCQSSSTFLSIAGMNKLTIRLPAIFVICNASGIT
jgi:hypothetical protein